MEHIGIDLGSRDSQVCVRNSAGEIVEEARRPTRELGPWLATRPSARVILFRCPSLSNSSRTSDVAMHQSSLTHSF